ncbi:hypothetical protein ACFOOM_10015 [Streptomyces echinoruber]|uniref:hypothetical protein n=1 Tax=Streptomyces echinoruber TaxID=68898 RepID=UPI003616F485
MSEQQPPPEDDEPTVAHYRRADETKFPTHPAGQRASIEGVAAARGYDPLDDPSSFQRIADELNARGVPVDTAAGRLTATMYALFDKYERERRAEIIAAGGDPDDEWGHTLSRSNLISVARAHRNATRRAEQGDLDRLLDDLADEFDLTDVRIVRGVAAALADAMPRIAYKARERMSPDEIAQQTGYTTSRVAQFIRQEKERRAAAGFTRYSWRVDTRDADGTWVDREHGEDEWAPADLSRLAERCLDETGARDKRARVLIWEGDEGDDAAAVHRAERPAQ